MEIHMNKYFEDNNIILKNHHGGLKGTATARVIIEHKIEDGYQKKKLVVTASTDLSAAYDMVNHKILLKKLEYYGFTGRELDLFRSYLMNGKQYADINTKKSTMIECLDC